MPGNMLEDRDAIDSFIHSGNIESLQRSRHCTRHRVYTNEQNRYKFLPSEVYTLVKGDAQ